MTQEQSSYGGRRVEVGFWYSSNSQLFAITIHQSNYLHHTCQTVDDLICPYLSIRVDVHAMSVMS